MNRPRLRNVPRGSLLSTEVTEEISNQMWTHFFKDSVVSTKIETECFFHLSGFFVEYINVILDLIQ